MDQELWTYTEAANELGVSRQVVGGLAERLGITPKPVPRTGAAKGLDRDDIEQIRTALTPARPVGRPRKASTVSA